jgi:cytochrome c-type biogenesis protein CcmH/NrfG
MKLAPAKLESLNNLAWILATSTDPALRNGARSVELAQRALRISGDHPVLLQTLAAAYAESGRFAEADGTAVDGEIRVLPVGETQSHRVESRG